MEEEKNNKIDRRGGKRVGAGRKTKSKEDELIRKLSPYDDVALNALTIAMASGSSWAIKLFFQYRYGMPKQLVDITSGGESFNSTIVQIVKPDDYKEIEDIEVIDIDLIEEEKEKDNGEEGSIQA
jgi:hypothetical protein